MIDKANSSMTCSSPAFSGVEGPQPPTPVTDLPSPAGVRFRRDLLRAAEESALENQRKSLPLLRFQESNSAGAPLLRHSYCGGEASPGSFTSGVGRRAPSYSGHLQGHMMPPSCDQQERTSDPLGRLSLLPRTDNRHSSPLPTLAAQQPRSSCPASMTTLGKGRFSLRDGGSSTSYGPGLHARGPSDDRLMMSRGQQLVPLSDGTGGLLMGELTQPGGAAGAGIIEDGLTGLLSGLFVLTSCEDLVDDDEANTGGVPIAAGDSQSPRSGSPTPTQRHRSRPTRGPSRLGLQVGLKGQQEQPQQDAAGGRTAGCSRASSCTDIQSPTTAFVKASPSSGISSPRCLLPDIARGRVSSGGVGVGWGVKAGPREVYHSRSGSGGGRLDGGSPLAGYLPPLEHGSSISVNDHNTIWTDKTR